MDLDTERPSFVMQHLQGTTEGPFSVERNSKLHGTITGGAIVRKGVTFHIHGMITGNVTVEKGAEAILHGTVDGTIWNYGQVTVYGTTDMVVDCGLECQSVIHRAALIRMGPRPE